MPPVAGVHKQTAAVGWFLFSMALALAGFFGYLAVQVHAHPRALWLTTFMGGVGVFCLYGAWYIQPWRGSLVTPFRELADFFFQAEDGIRCGTVTGVQTCALPISRKANMPMRVTSEFTENARLRKRSSRSSGAAARRSAPRNATKKNTATTHPAITHGSDQPLVAPWITENSSANSEIAMVICPGQSSERPSGEEEFCAANATTVLIRARIATATKAQRQLAVGLLPHGILVTSPPSTGLTNPPEESAAAQIAMPRARLCTVCVPAATIASVVGKITAAPMPVSA